jgi:hypothetical protein
VDRYATCCTSQERRLFLNQLRTLSPTFCRFTRRIQIQDTQQGEIQMKPFLREHEASHTERALLSVPFLLCIVEYLDSAKMTL